MTLKKGKDIFLFIVLLAIVSQFAIDSFIPSFPYIAKYFHANPGLIQISISIYLLGMGTVQLLYGFLSDSYGRKPIILIGMLIFIMGSLLAIVSTSVYIFLISRLIQGVGAGAPGAVIRAMMKDRYAGNKLAKISSYLTMVITLTPPLAPTIGGYVQDMFNWQANFFLLFIISSLVAIAILLFCPETLLSEHKKKLVWKRLGATCREILLHKKFFTNAFSSGLAYACVILYMTITPFLYQHKLGLTVIQYGWLSFFNALALSVGSFVNGFLVMRMGVHRMIVIGIFSLIVSSFLMIFLYYLCGTKLIYILIPMFFTFIGVAFISANTMIEAIEPFAHCAGVASALYGVIQIIVTSFISFFAIILNENSQLPLAVSFVVVSVLICMIYFRRQLKI